MTEKFNVLNKVEALQKEIDRLEGIVGDHSNALSYLNNCKNGREQTFAYTNQQVPEQKFSATAKVNGKEIKILIEESTLKSLIENHEVLDKLHSARKRMKNIEDFLGEEV